MFFFPPAAANVHCAICVRAVAHRSGPGPPRRSATRGTGLSQPRDRSCTALANLIPSSQTAPVASAQIASSLLETADLPSSPPSPPHICPAAMRGREGPRNQPLPAAGASTIRTCSLSSASYWPVSRVASLKPHLRLFIYCSIGIYCSVFVFLLLFCHESSGSSPVYLLIYTVKFPSSRTSLRRSSGDSLGGFIPIQPRALDPGGSVHFTQASNRNIVNTQRKSDGSVL